MKHSFLKMAVAAITTSMLFSFNANAQHQIAIGAHRGFWKTEACKDAQNSIKSLQLAQKYGFWGNECDVQLTKDNMVVVNHDNDINGLHINSTNYADLKDIRLKNGEKLPTIDSFLKQVEKSDQTVLVLEIKQAENDERSVLLTDLCIQKLLDHNLYDPERVIFISFNLAACKHLAVVAPEFTTQYLSGNLSPDELHAYKINGLDYHFNVFKKNPSWVKRAHELGMSVNCWTVNKENDIQDMIDLNVDCITTNEPLLVRKMLGTREKQIVK